MTIRRAAERAAWLEAAGSLPPAEASPDCSAIPGVGPWTAAETARSAFGDPDAVSVGDFHLPNLVSWALAGEPRGDDARMLELLEPYPGSAGAGGPAAGAVGHPGAAVRTADAGRASLCDPRAMLTAAGARRAMATSTRDSRSLQASLRRSRVRRAAPT